MALEAKRKAEEEAAKAERERKLEEERQRREQERLRKEEERRQREEERIRKEEDKRRRLKEERERAAEKEKKRKEKEEKEQREREERERIEREKKEALAAKEKAEQDERRAKEQQEELARQEKAKVDMGKSSSPLPTTTTPMRPVIDEAARQKTLMDALVGAPASSSSSSSPQPLLNRTSLLSAGIANIPHSMPGDIKPLGMDMPQPPHPLFPPHPFAARDIPPPIGPVRQGEPATSPTRGYAPLGDRGMLPIGHGRLSSSFDAGRTVARPGAQIAPIGQPVNGRRPATTAGPVGSPMGSRTHWLNNTDDGSSKRSPLATSDAENSFFSNFLFGDHGRGIYAFLFLSVNSNMHCLDMSLMHPELATSRLQERRFSLESAGVGWTNGKIHNMAFVLFKAYVCNRLDCINSFIGQCTRQAFRGCAGKRESYFTCLF